MINNPLMQSFEAMKRESDKALCHLFAGRIKANFLMKILRRIQELVGANIQKYFDFRLTAEKIASGMDDVQTIDYEVCRYIVGTHRSNLVFLTEAERVAKEKDDAYCEQLANDVITNIKLRYHAGSFFRKMPIMCGESFICFPLPYDLFAISIRINEILSRQNSKSNPLYPLFVQISNKGLAALSMLEDNFLDNAYPICRGAMELYSKMLLLLNEPTVVQKYFKFVEYEVRQSCCEQTYPEEFNTLFDNRIKKSEYIKAEYLHFGWLDNVADYHKIVRQKPYSINGIITYLRSRYEEADAPFFDHFEQLFKMCHGYTHGSINNSKYPLLHYFEISIMLYYVLSHTYKIVCECYNETLNIDDVDIVAKLERDFEQISNQYNRRNTESFEAYYKLNPRI